MGSQLRIDCKISSLSSRWSLQPWPVRHEHTKAPGITTGHRMDMGRVGSGILQRQPKSLDDVITTTVTLLEESEGTTCMMHGKMTGIAIFQHL